MASAEQMQQMLDVLQQQVTTMANLQKENERLRDATATESPDGDGPTESGTKYKSKRPDRPIVDRDIDDRDWAVFVEAWGRYKEMCHVKDTDVSSIRLELRASCSNEVNKLLFEYVGATKLSACSENELLGYIKSVAVKTVHKEVHRMAFHKMVQDQGESITQWTARLKSKAFLCKFEIPCSCCTPAAMISYADEEIAQVLVAGLRNQEHTRKVLAEAATLTTLELKVKRLQILELTEESVVSLHNPSPPSEAAPVKSQYKAAKMTDRSSGTTPTPATKCRWCGKTSHPKGGELTDRKKCPAFGKKCNKCGIKGHHGVVCENSAAAAAETGETEDLQPLAADASVSFAFGAESNLRDFRLGRKSKGRT